MLKYQYFAPQGNALGFANSVDPCRPRRNAKRSLRVGSQLLKLPAGQVPSDLTTMDCNSVTPDLATVLKKHDHGDPSRAWKPAPNAGHDRQAIREFLDRSWINWVEFITRQHVQRLDTTNHA